MRMGRLASTDVVAGGGEGGGGLGGGSSAPAWAAPRSTTTVIIAAAAARTVLTFASFESPNPPCRTGANAVRRPAISEGDDFRQNDLSWCPVNDAPGLPVS